MNDVPKFKTFRDLKSVPKTEEKPSTSISSISSISSLPSSPRITSNTSSSPRTTSIGKEKKFQTEVSPVRDFQKIPNSIPRNLDLFRGKSKQVWDYLWSVSRGTINPSRTVRKSRKEIKENAKLGSMVTVDAAIEHLEMVGLLKVIPNVGSLGGNEYEIYTPEEIDWGTASISSIASTPSNTSLTQKVVHLDVPESSTTSTTQTIDYKTIYDDTKTSFKDSTKNDDDARVKEAFSVLEKKLDTAVKKLTGKGVSKYEADKWGMLAELLILEMEAAASRTDSISSVPAFLTEVLRRKLLGGNTLADKAARSKPDTIGKPNEAGEYEKKPLDQVGRETALLELQDFANEDFLTDFEKWYTAEDWSWLTAELGKIKQSQK